MQRYYKIFIADSTLKGLDIMDKEKIHLVITDQNMPNKFGIDFLEFIHQRYTDSVRVILTGCQDEGVVRDAVNKAKVFHYLFKPWDIHELKSVIDNAYEHLRLKEERFQLLKERKELQLVKERQMKQSIMSQYAILKNQVNPHFLFNCLNTLFSMLPKDTEARDFVTNLSKFYRKMLIFNKNNLVTLTEELEFVKSYFHLQKIRFGDAIEFRICVDDQQMRYKIPPLTLQLLIENAIKHNIKSISSPLIIEVYTSGEGSLILKNNFQKRQDQLESTGIGQRNIIERYQCLFKRKPQFYIKDGAYYAKLPLEQNRTI